ncbi:hypothetical protein [Salirhabdus salicampi]|uniref:hypothetical protein n=1 Tax=Salirhabdus salicampi TaxID=476102 RepID=UPI0020C43D3D|nr:hypothetical protein [Salirhabdus salicampi]MCP8617688.1 hypothetical protein [Salirhabdus salicampi]
MKKLYCLNIFNAIFAFLTSVIQTEKIINNAKKFNRKNTIFLLLLSIFAAVVSIVQSNIIIKKTTDNIIKTEKIKA